MYRVLSVAVVLLLVVPTCLFAQCQPEFVVTKMADPLVSMVGECVEYTIVVENTGTCDLMLVDVDDSLLGNLTAYFCPVLMAGDVEACAFLYEVEPSDPDPLVNIVTFVYTDPSGFTHEAADVAEVDLIHPGLTVSVQCMSPAPPGGYGEFQVMIVNTGDVDLIVETDEIEIPVFWLLAGDTFADVTSAPCIGDEACYTIQVVATLPEEYGLDNVYAASATDCCPCSLNPAEEHTWGRVKSLFRSEAGE